VEDEHGVLVWIDRGRRDQDAQMLTIGKAPETCRLRSRLNGCMSAFGGITKREDKSLLVKDLIEDEGILLPLSEMESRCHSVSVESISSPVTRIYESPVAAKRTPMRILPVVLSLSLLAVAGILVWQGLTSAGSPDPMAANTSPAAATLDIAVLVFREGLECILVLTALTASMVGSNEVYRRPIGVGVGLGILATLATWCVATSIMSDLSASVSALNLQAATGLVAVIVLLVVMNWFFHKMYWCGWISMHTRRKKDLMQSVSDPGTSKGRILRGLALLGFASLYREGFEVVLFLQSYYLKLGGRVVAVGALLGLILTGMVAVLTFVANRRLPYRKMLVATGVMLGGVLLVMVGEQAQEMQLAHWIPTTTISSLVPVTPAWAGLWFSIFPTVETLAAQGVAGALVIGSYFYARRQSGCVACPAGGSSVSGC
jgi:high-affinity iron transporter